MAYSKILVYGVTGSGKSTLAAQLGARLGLPYHPADDLTWEPGWVEVPAQEQRVRIAAVCEQPAWVLDSGYQKWIDIPMASVELIVGLDYPRWVSLGRLLRRTLRRSITGELICNGNRENLRGLLSKDSIVVWHFSSFARKRARMRQWQTELQGPSVLLFRSPRAARRWLSGLPEAT
jgi:adenylate kinase family enzyme